MQLDLSNYEVGLVNTTIEAQAGLSVSAKVYSLENKLLLQQKENRDVGADSMAEGFKLDLAPLFANGVLLVKLELRNAGGQLLSDNLYWLAAQSSVYRQLNRLSAASVSATANWKRTGDSAHVQVRLENRGSSAALENKLTLLDSMGARILPAYYSDNYVSLLPGESREIEIEYPATAAQGTPKLSIRGWSLTSATLTVEEKK